MFKLFVMDVDGTLTDGGLYYDSCGNEMKKFNVKDGAGIVQLHSLGIKTMILTGRESNCVKKRAEELEISYVAQGVKDKALYFESFMMNKNFESKDIAYIGDDINDIGIMGLAGYTACPADAASEVKAVVDVVCKRDGGQGAVREFIDYMLRSNIN